MQTRLLTGNDSNQRIGRLATIVVSVICVLGCTSTSALAQGIRAAAVIAPEPPALSADEIADLKTTYDALSPDEQAEMVAVFNDMGIDLLGLFGVPAGPGGPGATVPAPPAATLTAAVSALDFTRSPQAVLAARAQIGLQSPPMPAEDAAIEELAAWMHQHVMAGEWSAFSDFMEQRAGEEGEAIYAHVLQSTNQGDPGLLPEEILAISDAAPADLTDWQLDVLAQLLKSSASKSSMGPMLEQIESGTRLFGPQDPERRARTARFLSLAGFPVEAFAYLPSLAEAREAGDAQTLEGLARYHEARAKTLGAKPEADQHRRTAWELFGEITLLESAELDQRRQSLQAAVDLLPSIPPQPATAWLEGLFDDPSLAPATLEAVALKAMQIQDQKMGVEARAQAILIMKDAVDTLLDDQDVEMETLRVPLRMLTMSLVTAAEETIKENAPKRGVAPETGLLFRSLPGPQWRSAIEPSLAVRAYKAFVGVALAADDTDYALDLLDDGARQNPGQGEELADEFLRLWMMRLNPAPDPRMNSGVFIIYGAPRRPSAPLTRGRQRRNLDRLVRLLDVMEDIGIDGRRLDRMVDAFAACHGRSEAYQRETVVRVLGPIEELATGVSSGLAESMRGGLNGDWRSRDVQRDEGSKRTKTEIDAMVAEGYHLALELIESAIEKEPESWSHAMTRTALSYDFMQFKAEREQDPASYQAARDDLFRAFTGAATSYRDALQRGEVRADPSIYLTWFGIAMGSSDLAGLTVDDLQTEGAENADQFDNIREQMLSMDADAAQLHLGEFARRVIAAVPGLTPEVKSGVVRRAAYIVGDHPAGAPLRRMLDLYEDLLQDEIQLRLTIDGSDRVGDQPFGAVLSLRYTATIDREIGGFHQYLRNNVWMALAGQYQTVNLRDRLERSIELAFDGDLELIHIGFFEPMNPARPVLVDGKPGWQEKPVAYLVVRARDESVDHLPALQMDLNLHDSTGPVTLPIRSNMPLIDAVAFDPSSSPRPARNVRVTQTLDLRPLRNDDDGRVVKLEITALARGVVPPLHSLLDGLDDVLSGYAIGDDGIAADPLMVAGVETAEMDPWMRSSSDEDKDTYVEADDDGVFRLMTSRRWVLTYTPTSRRRGGEFTLPTLAAGIDGTMRNDRYEGMDLVEVATASVPVDPPGITGPVIILAGLLLIGVVAGLLLVFSRDTNEAATLLQFDLPDRVTPVTAVMTLQRIEREFGSRLSPHDRERLEADISHLERAYFAEDGTPGDDVAETLAEWVDTLRANGGFRPEIA